MGTTMSGKPMFKANLHAAMSRQFCMLMVPLEIRGIFFIYTSYLVKLTKVFYWDKVKDHLNQFRIFVSFTQQAMVVHSSSATVEAADDQAALLTWKQSQGSANLSFIETSAADPS